MTSTLSTFFNAARLAAAIFVLISHVEDFWVPGVIPFVKHLGPEAVGCFFVLSGFVIAFVSDTRETSLSSYAISRFARIYSVVIPCLVLTAICDYTGNWLRPSFYAATWPSTGGLAEALHLVFCLTFLSQSWHLNIFPGSNVPFWSICFEVMYYIIFGATYFLRGRTRWVALTMSVALAGPKILVCLPLWLTGAILYRVLSRTRLEPGKMYSLAAILILLLWVATEYLRARTGLLLETDSRRDVYVQMYIAGAIFSTLTFAIGRSTFKLENTRFVSLISESTFVIYLSHYPIGMLLQALLPASIDWKIQYILYLFVPLSVASIMSPFCERLRTKTRSLGRGRTRMSYTNKIQNAQS